MLGVCHIKARKIFDKYIDKSNNEKWRVLSKHVHAWLAHRCKFGEKIAQVIISQVHLLKIIYQVQMIIDIVEFT